MPRAFDLDGWSAILYTSRAHQRPLYPLSGVHDPEHLALVYDSAGKNVLIDEHRMGRLLTSSVTTARCLYENSACSRSVWR